MSDDKEKKKRSPVVVVMGHVDHGKTTLLDYIRKTSVAKRESGGITQSVGAYEINHAGEMITFIDTPGHEAFSKMRERGAKIADLAVLVVAADDGVNAQTKEVIKTLMKNELPFVVAINKIDKNNANIEKVKSDLATAGVLLEGFGGSVSFQGISALDGTGVSELLDIILLTSEVEGFTYSPSDELEAYVLEANKSTKTGITATLIIKNGTLAKGDEIFTQSTSGKVKGLSDFNNKAVKELTACSPAVVLGFNNIPKSGELVTNSPQVKSELTSKNELPPKDKKKLSFVIKADTGGSLEAIADAVLDLRAPADSHISVVSAEVGEITGSDAQLAISTNAYLIGYNVKTANDAKPLIEAHRVKVFSSKIIYEILEEIENVFLNRNKELVSGRLKILAAFDTTNTSNQIIGGEVTEGEIKSQGELELFRRDKKIGSGKILNLQQNKDDVQSVETGLQCGLRFNCETVIEKGDELVARPN